MQRLIKRANELLASGEVARVLGWRVSDEKFNPEPAYFENEKEMETSFITAFAVPT